MSFADSAIGRWIQSLGTPAANFTVDQVRQILRDVGELREYTEADETPAGFTVLKGQAHIYISWDHNSDGYVNELWFNRAVRSLDRTGYRSHYNAYPDPGRGNRFLVIRIPKNFR